jgi:PhzF family phenazine biosynthesis protein
MPNPPVRHFAFKQVDVFSAVPMRGNPLAVVLGADGLTDDEMAGFANWTNLSETTFLLPPTDAAADYRVRIFTPSRELPFAGHPTLGSCHAWLAGGGQPKGETVVQQCESGLIRIHREAGRLAFAAPPLLRAGPVDAATVANAAKGLGLHLGDILAANWIDNGPGWLGLLLASRAAVLAVQPNYVAMAGLRLGIAGPWTAADGTDAQFEVRAFTPNYEDPVTGGLNAGLAQWLIGAGIAPTRYIASQGTALGRAGRVHVDQVGPDIWIGGDVTTCIAGTVTL